MCEESCTLVGRGHGQETQVHRLEGFRHEAVVVDRACGPEPEQVEQDRPDLVHEHVGRHIAVEIARRLSPLDLLDHQVAYLPPGGQLQQQLVVGHDRCEHRARQRLRDGPESDLGQIPRALDAMADMVTQSALGREGMAEEVAAVAVFLASEEASYLTGTDVLVDGGSVAAFRQG